MACTGRKEACRGLRKAEEEIERKTLKRTQNRKRHDSGRKQERKDATRCRKKSIKSSPADTPVLPLPSGALRLEELLTSANCDERRDLAVASSDL